MTNTFRWSVKVFVEGNFTKAPGYSEVIKTVTELSNLAEQFKSREVMGLAVKAMDAMRGNSLLVDESLCSLFYQSFGTVTQQPSQFSQGT